MKVVCKDIFFTGQIFYRLRDCPKLFAETVLKPDEWKVRRLIEHASDEPVQRDDPGAIEYASWLPPLRPAAS